MQEIKKLIIIKNLRWRRVTSVYAVWGHVYILYRVEWHIFLVESRLTRLVCTSLGYHACALDSWKLPLMWPWSGGPAVEAGDLLARNMSSSLRVLHPRLQHTAALMLSAILALAEGEIQVYWWSLYCYMVAETCWKAICTTGRGRGEGLAVWFPYPSGHPKPFQQE